MNLKPSTTFSTRLIAWYRQYGRTDLPWQQQPTAYSIWISEIMLQQTQVSTVIPYYVRFIQQFPTINALAAASLDEVLHYWTGLGYYARARHLHKAAIDVCQQHGGILPNDINQLMALPGIGRSTAGAILALSEGQRHAILDGNVKRVLCRHHALAGWPGETQLNRQLWQLAEQLTPHEKIKEYTQAIMDLGATVCTRNKPLCFYCPVHQDCLAHQLHQETCYPEPKPRKPLPVKTTRFMMVENEQGEILLQQRQLSGIWGGLWSFPECALDEELSRWCHTYLNQRSPTYQVWPTIYHSFTHFHLEIIPVHLLTKTMRSENVQLSNFLWYDLKQPQLCGLAAPVVRLLTQLRLFKEGEFVL